jgi:hypothetical protein
MPRRKTVNVDIIVRRINGLLAMKSSTPEAREALCAHLEGILFETGNYCGFRYLETDEVLGAGTRREYFIPSERK